jgi:sugar phosphate isomerase/epimerase
VQLSDLIATKHERFRAVPGDGIFPILRILDWIFSAGYDGFIDLELSRDPSVPVADTARRAIEVTSRMLDELGV